MELTSLQIELARLSIDAALRTRFAADPKATAESLGLCAEDAASLARLEKAGLDRFASTLVRKELKRIRHELPQLCGVLGDRLQALVAEFQEKSSGSQRRNASAFAKFVARRVELDALTRDVARLEGRVAHARRSRLPLRMCLVCHRLDELTGSPPAALVGVHPLRLAFIVRMFGRIRIWYCPLVVKPGRPPTTCPPRRIFDVVGSEKAH